MYRGTFAFVDCDMKGSPQKLNSASAEPPGTDVAKNERNCFLGFAPQRFPRFVAAKTHGDLREIFTLPQGAFALIERK